MKLWKRHKLTIAQYYEIRRAVALRRSLRSKELAAKYGVSVSLIQAISLDRRTGTRG